MRQYSYSKLNLYKTCPKSYFFRYVKSFPSKKEESLAIRLGKATHALINARLNGHKIEDEIEKKFDIKLKDIENQVDKAIRLIERYKDYAFESEYYFGLDKKLNTVKFDDAYIRGIIDILLLNENIIIFDWKTGLTTYSEDQLLFYALVISKIFNTKKIKMAFVYLDSMKLDWVEIKDFDKEEEKIFSIIETIEKDNTFREKKSYFCNWCDFREHCFIQNNVINLNELVKIGVKIGVKI